MQIVFTLSNEKSEMCCYCVKNEFRPSTLIDAKDWHHHHKLSMLSYMSTVYTLFLGQK